MIKINVTIESGQATSATVKMNGLLLCSVKLPAAWTAAALTFVVNGGDSQSISGLGEYSVPVGASQSVPVEPMQFLGVDTLQLRSGTAGTPVNQSAARIITLYCEQIDRRE